MAVQSSAYNRVSFVNSTTTPLAAAGTFTGTWEDALGAESVLTTCKTDQNCTLYMDFSPDKTNVDSTLSFPVYAGVSDSHRLSVIAKYYRMRVTNTSGTPQTYLRAQSLFGSQPALTSGLTTQITQDADAIVTRSITEEIMMAQGLLTGYFIQGKYGENIDVDAAEDIWDGGGDYTGFPVGVAETVSLVSASAADAAAGTGMRTMQVYGLDANFALQNETVSLNGTNPATTVGIYSRVYQVAGLTAGTGTTNAGAITVRHTSTTGDVFSIIPLGTGQSRISAFTIPAGYTGYMNQFSASMFDTTANQARIGIWRRDFGGCVRIQRPFVISTNFTAAIDIYGGLSFPAKTDIVFRALSVENGNADISVQWSMILVKA